MPVIDNCELPYELQEPISGLQEQKSSELPSYLFFPRDKDLESSLIRCSFSKRVVGYKPGRVEFLNHGFLARFIALSTTFRLHLTPVRMAKIKKTKDNKCHWGCGVKRQPLRTVCRMQINAATTDISVAIPQKTRNSFSLYIFLPYDPAMPLPGTHFVILFPTKATHAHPSSLLVQTR